MRTLGSLVGAVRPGVKRKRIVPPNHTDFSRKIFFDFFDGRLHAFAKGAVIIAEFHPIRENSPCPSLPREGTFYPLFEFS
jgi:hypothetical protein